jgi:CIC family chloride channel protein
LSGPRKVDVVYWLVPLAVGAVAGVAASAINYVIFTTWATFYGDALKTPTLFYIFPFTGLALSYFLVHLLAWYRTPKSSFHTILEVFHLTPTGMMPRETIVKTMSGIVTCVFGGSAGPEGPSSILSGGFSTWLYKATGRRMDSRRALMVGVAAGFSASFKTPLTGLLFALELPYRRDLEKESFIEAAVASSMAYLVAVALDAPSLLPNLQLDIGAVPLVMLPIAMVFGLGTGTIVFVFTKIYQLGEEIAKKLFLKGGYPLMLIIGGFVIGSIGYICPQAVGPGYQMVSLLSGGALASLALVLILRPIATSFTLTLGGTGGLFLPTLLIGGAWGCIVGTLFAPGMVSIFTLMGMAAFSSGIHKMMLTPIIFVAEVFGAHTIIPIILATVVCFFISGTYGFYPIQPTNKASQEDLALERFYYKVSKNTPKELEKLTANDIATQNPISLRSELTIREALEEFGKTAFRLMPVVDDEERVIGYAALENLAFLSKTMLDKPLSSVDLNPPVVFNMDTPILKIIEIMISKQEDHIFIVDGRGHLKGIISTIDMTRLLMRYYANV